MSEQLNKEQVLAALRSAEYVPRVGKNPGRNIYEIAGARGHFHLDYATFPGGTTGEVPREVIDELLREGLIERASPDAPGVNAWKLV